MNESQVLVRARKKRKVIKNAFIDDEAELSGSECEVSEDEHESSDDDKDDLELVDKEAAELDSDQEEEIRGLYQKQLETEDKRALLLLQEQLEDKEVSIGQQRRRRFRWQTNDNMGSMERHYNPDDEDSQDNDDDDYEYDQLVPRLRRPTEAALLLGSTKLVTKISTLEESNSMPSFPTIPVAGPSFVPGLDDESSNATSSRLTSGTNSKDLSAGINRFLYRDREVVAALSTKEIVTSTREERERQVQRELKKLHASKSIFDVIYN